MCARVIKYFLSHSIKKVLHVVEVGRFYVTGLTQSTKLRGYEHLTLVSKADFPSSHSKILIQTVGDLTPTQTKNIFCPSPIVAWGKSLESLNPHP